MSFVNQKWTFGVLANIWLYFRLYKISHCETCRTLDIYWQYGLIVQQLSFWNGHHCIMSDNKILYKSFFFHFSSRPTIRKIQPFIVDFRLQIISHLSEQQHIVTTSLKVDDLPSIDSYILYQLYRCIFWSFYCNILP